MEFRKGRQKENKESKQKRKETNILKQAFWGEQSRQKSSKNEGK